MHLKFITTLKFQPMSPFIFLNCLTPPPPISNREKRTLEPQRGSHEDRQKAPFPSPPDTSAVVLRIPIRRFLGGIGIIYL